MSKHLKRAYEQMKANKDGSLVDSSLTLHFKEVNCNEWNTAKQLEYSTLYPSHREPTTAEQDTEYQEYLTTVAEGEEAIPADVYEYTQVAIEYEYCEWIETVPAVYSYADDGTETLVTAEVPGYYTLDACTPTYDQWLNGAVCPEYDAAHDVADFKATDVEYSVYKKYVRTEAVSNIVVTTAAGNAFDGDEISQSRMDRAVTGLSVMGDGATITWVLHDNTRVDVTATELKEAIALSGQAQSLLW